jgi:hypothetical protein
MSTTSDARHKFYRHYLAYTYLVHILLTFVVAATYYRDQGFNFWPSVGFGAIRAVQLFGLTCIIMAVIESIIIGRMRFKAAAAAARDRKNPKMKMVADFFNGHKHERQ